jgi:transglutaminase-like putative cysteine protease
MFDVYSGIIKMSEGFRDDGMDITIRYLLGADYKDLYETYKLKEIAGTNADFDRAINLMNWISSNIYHCGNYDNHVTNTAMELLAYAIGKGEKYGINCRSLSLALTECLLAVGIKARTIYIVPFSPYDFDNHVVCEAWISDINKWVMLDPTYNLFATFNGIPLNIYELRRCLGDQEEVTYNNGANYNGTPINKNEITTYYAKDLYRFLISDIQGINSENIDGQRSINITPCGYDVKKSTLANIDFRIIKSGNNENLQAWRKSSESDTFIYKGLDILY